MSSFPLQGRLVERGGGETTMGGEGILISFPAKIAVRRIFLCWLLLERAFPGWLGDKSEKNGHMFCEEANNPEPQKDGSPD